MRAGRLAAFSFVAGGVLLTAGCTPGMRGGEAWPPPERAVTAPAPHALAPRPPLPAHKPAVEAPEPAAGAASPPAATTPAPAGTPPAAANAPETPANFTRLQGLDQAATIALLGQPQSRAEAPPATLWRYMGPDCELDVYFYLDLQTREMRVLHYEVRSHDGAEQPQQQCYGELVTERQSQGKPGAAANPPR